MAATYDPSDLDPTTTSGKLNSVRFLIGDTDMSDPIVQDEEITFALAQSGENIYKAGAFLCRSIANKYAREVDIDLDGQLAVEGMSDLADKYLSMAQSLESTYKSEARVLGVSGGGLTKQEMLDSLNNTTKVQSRFRQGQFDNPQYGYLE